MYFCWLSDVSGTAAVSAAAPVTTKKKKEDTETGRAAVRARYLMEKYGTKWRLKAANGAYTES